MTASLPSTCFDIQGPDGVLRAESWGPADAPVIVLVHGYPDNRSEWREVAEQLADQYRVVAYDVRGAGDSFKPTGRAAYRLDRLTADFKAVIDAVSPNRPVHLVGHDWGSVQSWEFVTEPSLKGRIASYVSCSGPCLDHMGFWLRGRLSRPTPRHLYQFVIQMLKSWYVYMFQLPWWPEAQWRLFIGKHWPTLVRWTEGTIITPRPTQVSDGMHGVWLYRANVFQRVMAPRERHAQAPVMVLVATKDNFVSPWLSEDLSRWVPSLERREIKAAHWVNVADPVGFASHVRSFIQGPKVAR
ncbi:MAG: alpha/beta fold hydrolase [Aquabacterium sp.]|uniref:alpha/beta fold hydrolase n=1 Tax=Aquabacterium sp. TaxID=1872578 RepID=UPI001217CC81|nr:alpha/beta fold hydrolase [Aquabacterium sp.]TAK96719.1 MAG: alpha/beta fold hydrolase [Aquabacterium sp.]